MTTLGIYSSGPRQLVTSPSCSGISRPTAASHCQESNTRAGLAAISASGRLAVIGDEHLVIFDPSRPESVLRRIGGVGIAAARLFLADDTLQIDRVEDAAHARDRSPRPVRIVREEHRAPAFGSDVDASISGRTSCETTVMLSGPLGEFRLSPRCEYLITSEAPFSPRTILNPTTLQVWERRALARGHEDDGGDSQDAGPVTFAPTFALSFERGISSMLFAADGSQFVTASGSYRTQVWDANSGREVQRIDHSSIARAAALGPPANDAPGTSGKSVVATASGSRAAIWQMTASGIDRRVPRQPRLVTRALQFSPDVRLLAVSTTRFFELWDIVAGRLLVRDKLRYGVRQIENRWPAIHPHPRTPIFLDSDARLLVPGERETVIYDLSGNRQSAVSYATADVVAPSPDGNLVAIASGESIEIVRIPDGSRVARIEVSSVRDLAIARGNRHLAAIANRALHLWDLRTNRPVDLGAPSDVRSLAFSPDGRLLAVGGARVAIYDLTRANGPEKLAEHEALPQPEPNAPADTTSNFASAIGFSPNGELMVAIWGDARLTVWRTTEREPLLDERIDQLQSATFSPDGSVLAAVGRNEPVRVWDRLGSGAPREILRIPHREDVRTLTFSPEGRTLASASSDDMILLSPVRLDDLLAEAMKRLPRNLTQREWLYYFGGEPYRCTVPALADCVQEPQRALK